MAVALSLWVEPEEEWCGVWCGMVTGRGGEVDPLGLWLLCYKTR